MCANGFVGVMNCDDPRPYQSRLRKYLVSHIAGHPIAPLLETYVSHIHYIEQQNLFIEVVFLADVL